MKCLYVTDRGAIGDARFESVLDALRGAPSLTLELREKSVTDREILRWADVARSRLGPAVPVLVNRRLDLAMAAGADGVHLPADGLPPARVRANAPRGFRVGVSAHSAAEATRAIEAGADVVVLGPIFATPSKAAYGAPLGAAVLADLPASGSHDAEVFAIGGIDEERLDALEKFRDRIAGVAAVRLIQESDDPRAVVERIAAR